MGPQCQVLKDHTKIAAFRPDADPAIRRNLLARDPDASFVRCYEACYQAKHRCFSASRRTVNDDTLSFIDLEGEARDDRASAVRLRNIPELDCRHASLFQARHARPSAPAGSRDKSIMSKHRPPMSSDEPFAIKVIVRRVRVSR